MQVFNGVSRQFLALRRKFKRWKFYSSIFVFRKINLFEQLCTTKQLATHRIAVSTLDYTSNDNLENSGGKFHIFKRKLDSEPAAHILKDYDVVIDYCACMVAIILATHGIDASNVNVQWSDSHYNSDSLDYLRDKRAWFGYVLILVCDLEC